MKKFIVSVLLILMLALVPTTTVAYADNNSTLPDYYRVNSEGVVMYENNNGTPIKLFEIPKTYFVKKDSSLPTFKYEIAGTVINFVPITYKNKKGYIAESDFVSSDKLTIANESEKSKILEKEEFAYFNKKIKLIKGYIQTDFVIEKNTELSFMGQITKDDILYYVVDYNNRYVELAVGEYVNEINIPSQSFPADNNSNVVSGGGEVSPYNRLSTNILIVGIAVACVVLIIAIFRPRKKVVTRDDYDDNDYYNDYRDRYHKHNRR